MASGRLPRMLAFAVGMAFTASCFTALAAIGGLAGNLSPLAVFGGALVAAFIMSAVAELAARFPSAIGIRTYVRAAFGERSALFVVLLYLAMILLVAALESSLVADVLRAAFPRLDGTYVIVLIFVGLFVINLVGFELSARVQLLLVVLLALGVTALVGGALVAELPNVTAAVARADTAAFIPAVVIAVFLFAGIEWVTVLHVRSLQDARHIHTVLFAAVACLALLYVGFAYGMVRLSGHVSLDGNATPQLVVAGFEYGQLGVYGVVALTLIAVITTFNAGLIGAARLLYSLARDSRLPSAFARVTSSGCPWVAAAVVCVASCAAALMTYGANQTVAITEASAAVACTVYAVFLAAAARLRATRADRPLPYRSPAPTWALWGGSGVMVILVLADIYQSLSNGRALVVAGFVLVLLMLPVLKAQRGASAPSYS